ncbi:uncharacterized protein LOC111872682 isoform X2 [Cryptotermes secundus]|uniref:uncharacterized protein LOC111872682 isoform X2 n=1 Tax=Cryptotermes secundus TaxID=105785 RepID=UPI000CD7CBE9|nr:uncharacterized protein LOC111872682 isoform X2 [Cryptotermes secundus]
MRSSVRLKSMSSGYQELSMVISELRGVRSTAKAFAEAQCSAAQDMLKWSLTEENPAIRDTFFQLSELSALWTEVQKEFADHLKEFVIQFEMILEGEHHVDQARTHVAASERRAVKIKNKLNKASKRGNVEETRQLEMKLTEAKDSCDLAQIEMSDRIQENEGVKLIRVKEGLLKLSDSYLELAHKCHIIHEAHRDIAYQIPDVHNKELHEITYAGPELSKQAVLTAKDRVRLYNRHAEHAGAPVHEGPPPPYSPPRDLCNTTPYNPYYTHPFYISPHTFGSHETNDENSSNRLLDSDTQTHLPTNPDVTRHSDYEDDLAGAVGSMKP